MDWKLISEIPGYEAFINYELNIAGDLRNRKTCRLLKWSKRKDGYSQAKLCQHPFKPKIIKKHVAICRLFRPNPENKLFIDHFNKKKWDNSFDNLRWATRAENNQNQCLRSDNTSGEHNIYPRFNRHGTPIWLIVIKSCGQEGLPSQQHTKQFPRDFTSGVIPQKVIDKRNEMKRTYHPTASVNSLMLRVD